MLKGLLLTATLLALPLTASAQEYEQVLDKNGEQSIIIPILHFDNYIKGAYVKGMSDTLFRVTHKCSTEGILQFTHQNTGKKVTVFCQTDGYIDETPQ